jgi:hypothetical protein
VKPKTLRNIFYWRFACSAHNSKIIYLFFPISLLILNCVLSDLSVSVWGWVSSSWKRGALTNRAIFLRFSAPLFNPETENYSLDYIGNDLNGGFQCAWTLILLPCSPWIYLHTLKLCSRNWDNYIPFS